MLSYSYYWISTLVAIPYCLIPLLVLLVTSCHLYTYVLGLSCLLRYYLSIVSVCVRHRIFGYVLFVFKEPAIP